MSIVSCQMIIFMTCLALMLYGHQWSLLVALRIVCRLYIRTTRSSQAKEAWSHPMIVAVGQGLLSCMCPLLTVLLSSATV